MSEVPPEYPDMEGGEGLPMHRESSAPAEGYPPSPSARSMLDEEATGGQYGPTIFVCVYHNTRTDACAWPIS